MMSLTLRWSRNTRCPGGKRGNHLIVETGGRRGDNAECGTFMGDSREEGWRFPLALTMTLTVPPSYPTPIHPALHKIRTAYRLPCNQDLRSLSWRPRYRTCTYMIPCKLALTIFSGRGGEPSSDLSRGPSLTRQLFESQRITQRGIQILR